MKRIGNLQNGPWLVIGDYNAVSSKEEKWGGKVFRLSHAKDYLEFIEDTKLIDFGIVGPKYTWTNK